MAGVERSLVAPIAVWDDETYTRAPHNVAAAAIAAYVEARRRCSLLRGCERVVGLGVAYWPFYISRRHDGRLVVVDLLKLHSFRLRLLELGRIAELIAFAAEASKVSANHVAEFMAKLSDALSENIASRTVAFEGVPAEADHLEQLTLISSDGRPQSSCVMEQAMGVEEAEQLLLKLDVLCDNILEEYQMLEKLNRTLAETVARMAGSIEEEMRRVIGEYTRAVRAIQARINARIASVRGEIEQRMGEVWEKYSRRLGELSAKLDNARRMGVEGEAEKLEKMIDEVRREYERETESIERQYTRMVRGEVRELETLEREKEEKLERLRGEMGKLHRLADQVLTRISRLLDSLVEIRSSLCSAGTISPYTIGVDRALLHVPVAVARFSSGRTLLVPVLAVQPQGEGRAGDFVRPLAPARRLLDRLARAGSGAWRVGLRRDCLVGRESFVRLVRGGVAELVSRGVLTGEDAGRLLERVDRFWVLESEA